jgi:hypothetical protein
VSFTVQDDRKCADIAGAPFSLDRAIFGQIEATKHTKASNRLAD